MKVIPLVGRILFSFLFLYSAPHHFSASTINYAAAQGVPAASVLVPASGILALAGAISIVLGYKAKVGGWLIVLFLLPVTFYMHNFWAVPDPMMRQMQMGMFMKNISMLGGALLIAYFGAGPLSFDASKQINLDHMKATHQTEYPHGFIKKNRREGKPHIPNS